MHSYEAPKSNPTIGTPAFFIHSYEALHGDMGGVVPGDVAILVSYSGATAEVCTKRSFRRYEILVSCPGATADVPLEARKLRILNIGLLNL